MSDLTPDPQPTEAPAGGDPWASFVGAFADLPSEDAPVDASTPADSTPPADEQPAAPAEPAPTPDPTAQARDGQGRFTPADPTVPTWSGQEEAGRAFRDVRAELAKKEADAAYWRGVAEGRITPPVAQQPAQAETTDADPEPDPSHYTTDEGYWKDVRAWDRRQVAKEVRAELQPVAEAQQRSATVNSFAVAQATVGPETWQAYWRAVDEASTDMPHLVDQVLKAKDPGAEVLKLGKRLAGGLAPTPAAPATPAPAAGGPAPTPVPAGGVDMAALLANPELQQTLLRALAQQQAAAGAPPPTPQLPPGPRGLGPSGGGVNPDAALTVEGVRAMRGNPQGLRDLTAGLLVGTLGL